MWQSDLESNYMPGLGALRGVLSPPARQISGPVPGAPTPPGMYNTRAEFLPSGVGALEAFLPPAVQEPEPGAPLIDQYNNPGRDKWMWLLQAGLGTAEAASKPGATAIGAIGAGGGAATRDLIKTQADRARQQQEEQHRRATLAVQLTQAQKELGNQWDVKISDGGDAVMFNKKTGETRSIPGVTGGKEKGEYAFLVGKIGDPNTSPEDKARYERRLKALETSGAPAVTVSVTGEKESLKSFGKGAGDRLNAVVADGQKAFTSLRQLDSLEDKLETTTTGPLASPLNTVQALAENARIDLQEHAKKLGINLNNVADPTVFGALAESLVIENLSKMGARPTDRDMASLRSTFAGLGKSPEANRQLIALMRAQFDNSINEARNTLEAMKDDPDFGPVTRYDRAIFENNYKKYESSKADREARYKQKTSGKPVPIPEIKSKYLEMQTTDPEAAKKYLEEAIKRGDIKVKDIRDWLGTGKQ